MKNSAPRVSIVIPMFNTERYIGTCIESILGQTFRDFELIVVDDCSTDRSAEVVRSYRDPRIRLETLARNSGSGAAMNHAFDLSRGEFVYIMDSDDAIMPETLQTLFDAAEKFDADVVHMARYFYTAGEDFSDEVRIETEQDFFTGLQPSKPTERLKELGYWLFFPAWLNLYRGSLLRDRKIRFPEFRSGSNDVFFLLSILCLAERFVKIDEPLYVYRSQRQNSFSNSANAINIERFVASYPVMLKYFRELFAREDLIESIPREFQIKLITRVISMIFLNDTIFDEKQLRLAIKRLLKDPNSRTEDFLEDALMMFFLSMPLEL